MSDKLEERGKALENEYFRRKEQELIQKMKARLEEEATKDLQLECPKCDGHLYESQHEGVAIDICDSCSGVWLDAGELAQIVDSENDKGWLSRFFG